MKWKKISSKLVYKNKWMEITEDIIKSSSGKLANFGIVHKKPFALIIPWDGKCITLVGQYRYPVDYFSWEFPMGHAKEHASIIETAKEELEEETGLKAKKIKKVATFFLATGHHTQICNTFLATGLMKGQQKLDDSEEDMKVKKVTMKEFEKMIKNGKIKDGPTLAAFGLAKINNLFK
jgi:ADP-ribose pyrophosphatase